MGKRKERRLAALSNAGRRVKLDLFAEPSGDLGGSSVHEEVEEDKDLMQSMGLPNSPSSSGKQPQNPLLLLGQYSDDEVDEELNKMPNDSIADNSMAEHNDQDGPVCEGKVMDVSEDDVASEKVKQVDTDRLSNPLNVSTTLEVACQSDAIASADKIKQMGLAEQPFVPGMTGVNITGDASFHWKMVLHEESNQYYYWNTETGETSWEVPAVLAQTTQLSFDQNAHTATTEETASINANNSGCLDVSVDGPVDANWIPQSQKVNIDVQNLDGLVEGCKTEFIKDKNCASDAHSGEQENDFSASNACLENGSLAVSENLYNKVADDEQNNGVDLFTNVMQQCERLLGRMRFLKGNDDHAKCPNQMWKYILEVETRLSDIKSLSSYGSSLLPFWAHSEKQLNRLEDAINNEIYQLAVSAQMDDDVQEMMSFSSKEKDKSQGSTWQESEAERCENSEKSEFSPVLTHVENHFVHVENHLQNEAAPGINSSLGSPTRLVEGGTTVGEEVNDPADVKPEFHDAEDVDMDVDMEVEDGIPAVSIASADVSGNKDVALTIETVQPPNGHAEYPLMASGDALTVPPPPEEEWIPPPPPDNDQIPPPPPDNDQVPPPPPGEPPESIYPPHHSYAEMGQPITYSEQYNLTYPDSSYQYYGATVTVPSNFYGHNEAGQVVPHPPIYYETVPNTYAETPVVMVGSVDPAAYYNLQDGSVPHVPVAKTVVSSLSNAESGHDTLTFGQTGTVNDPSERKIQEGNLDVSATASDPDIAIPSTSTTYQAPVTNGKESVYTSSTNTATAAVAAPASSTAIKVQSKVLRSKKRTVAVAPSLRSNKKVSSLVDKWKAAKEELNENADDEPDNAYEILEKKRQREIEEWKAKQIASGEAKDNANFQPLGGDWRERVKRRRAQAAKEASRTPPKTTDENQMPDLAELSKNLPSGWQAYWDENLKQVYYGNVNTSETTWDRPTK